MSRRTNILLILALAAGFAYGCFSVPFLLPLVSDDTEATAEEADRQPLSEADELRFRMLLLKPGMDHGEVARVLGLANKQRLFKITYSNGSYLAYPIDQRHTLRLVYDSAGLVSAAYTTRWLPVLRSTPAK